MIDKKQIQTIFLFKFKMGCKAVETTHNIKNTFAQELLMKVQCTVGSRSSAKEMRALKMRNIGAGHQERTMTNWENHQSWPFNNYTRVTKELHVCHSTVTWHLKQTGKVKKLSEWVPHELPQIQQKLVILNWSKSKSNGHLLLFYATTMSHFSSGEWCATKSGFLFWTTDNDQLSGWTEEKLQSISQSQSCTTKRSWSLFGGLLPVWPTTVFWILEKPLHLRFMISKSMRCTKNFNACSQHCSTKRAQFFSTTAPKHTSHNQPFRSRTSWAVKFCLIPYIPLNVRQPTITSSSISTTFSRINTSTTSMRQKMLSKTWSNPEAQIFTVQE